MSQEQLGSFESDNFRLNGEIEEYRKIKETFEEMKDKLDSKVRSLSEKLDSKDE